MQVHLVCSNFSGITCFCIILQFPQSPQGTYSNNTASMSGMGTAITAAISTSMVEHSLPPSPGYAFRGRSACDKNIQVLTITDVDSKLCVILWCEVEYNANKSGRLTVLCTNCIADWADNIATAVNGEKLCIWVGKKEWCYNWSRKGRFHTNWLRSIFKSYFPNMTKNYYISIKFYRQMMSYGDSWLHSRS